MALEKEKRWSVSCSIFSVLIYTDGNGKITYAAPIVKKFTGQSLSNLTKWARRFGQFSLVDLDALEESLKKP